MKIIKIIKSLWKWSMGYFIYNFWLNHEDCLKQKHQEEE